MFKIGVFSKLNKVSIRMLRYYDEVGLFKPSKIDDFTGYRYYSAKQIKNLNLIVYLRDLGFNVSEIAQIMSANSDAVKIEILYRKKLEVEAVVKLEGERLENINSAINNLDKERINMDYNVIMKSIPACKVIACRDIIPNYSQEGMLWQRLGQYVGKNSIQPCGISFATYYDESYKERDVDVEVLMEVKSLGDDEAGITYRTIEGIEEAASILVPGDYGNIGPAFQFMASWIEDNNYTPSGNARQYTIKGPWNEENSEDYLTEIVIPVSKDN